ncbi:MAG: YqaE/Pmp3 family membrane protein [Lentisphaeria bacterium]|nr:YqaE/Pmp3 family membrane protein [Lentisphaeria bacterium]
MSRHVDPRILLCIIFPPLAVFDKGCGVILLVFFLTLLGWLPGTIAALVFCLNETYAKR